MKDIRSASMIRIADIDLNCQLFPEELWAHSGNQKGRDRVFFDHAEATQQVRIHFVDDSDFPIEPLVFISELKEFGSPTSLFSDRDRNLCQKVLDELRKWGQSGYPRLAAPPRTQQLARGEALTLVVARNLYGLALIAEHDLNVNAHKLRLTV